MKGQIILSANKIRDRIIPRDIQGSSYFLAQRFCVFCF